MPCRSRSERAMNPHNTLLRGHRGEGVGVEDTLKPSRSSSSSRCRSSTGTGAAPRPPGAPRPPRRCLSRVRHARAALAVSTDELLGELDLGEPERTSPPAAADLPPIEFDEDTRWGPLPGAGADSYSSPRGRLLRPRPRPAEPPGGRSRRTARRARSSPKRDEAEELRRRITEPGLSEDVEMDLEEIEDFDQPSHAMLVPARTTDTTAPEPLLRPEVASATEVEVRSTSRWPRDHPDQPQHQAAAQPPPR